MAIELTAIGGFLTLAGIVVGGITVKKMPVALGVVSLIALLGGDKIVAAVNTIPIVGGLLGMVYSTAVVGFIIGGAFRVGVELVVNGAPKVKKALKM